MNWSTLNIEIFVAEANMKNSVHM